MITNRKIGFRYAIVCCTRGLISRSVSRVRYTLVTALVKSLVQCSTIFSRAIVILNGKYGAVGN